jgi:hypothetical protein
MKQAVAFVLINLCGFAAAGRLCAQAPANSGSSQPQPANTQTDPQKPKPQESNPFPDDTNSVPVMPTATTSGAPIPEPDGGDYGSVPLPSEAGDPVRSPDDGPLANTNTTGSSSSSSSSSAGMEDLLKPPPDVGKKGKRGNSDEDDGMKHDSPQEDESVGSYYLDQKNWKGALSRFESAMVLDPENPEVYWGLGEAERHLGNFAAAKAHYLKLEEYDPDSKHGKEAKKILKEPELANAPAVSSNAGTLAPQIQQ